MRSLILCLTVLAVSTIAESAELTKLNATACQNRADLDKYLFMVISNGECSSVRGAANSLCQDFRAEAAKISEEKCIAANGSYPVVKRDKYNGRKIINVIQATISGKRYWAMDPVQ